MRYKALLLSGLISISAYAEKPSFKPKNMQAFNNYINGMLVNEKQSFINGAGAFFSNSLRIVSSSQIIHDYKTNKREANRTYKGKYVHFVGHASAIKEGETNNPYIVVNGQNQSENTLIYIDPNDDRFLDISQGDMIDLICKGNGELLKSPIFNKCLFPSDFADKAIELIKNDAISSASKGIIPSIQESAIFIVTYKALENVLEKQCLIDSESCMISLNENARNINIYNNISNYEVYMNSFNKLKPVTSLL